VDLFTTPPAQGANVIAEAFLTDPAGNVSVVSDDIAVMDVLAPFVPTVIFQITNTGTPIVSGTAAVTSCR